MKYLNTKIIILLAVIFLSPSFVEAASFNVSPSATTYTVGDNIIIPISVNPNTDKIYTVTLNATFSKENISVQSFTLNDSWIPLKQEGYDAINNNTGSLIKTGGYPGGISSTASFGKLVLKAKKAGTATLMINDSSTILDGSNTDKQSGTQVITLNIKSLVVPKKAVTPLGVPTTTIEIQESTTTPDIGNEGLLPPADNASLPAASTDSGFSVNPWWWIVLGIIIIATALFIFFRKKE